MSRLRVAPAASPLLPRAWRILLVVFCTLILCSCQARPPVAPGPSYSGVPSPALPRPYTPGGPWAPPGIAQPWPLDEYLADGGDDGVAVAVTPDKQLSGLEAEDAVAYYETRDGRTVVEPTNRVHLYSPRFRAVRQVVAAKESEQLDRTSGVVLPVQALAEEGRHNLAFHKQNLQSMGRIGQKSVTTFRTRQGDGAVSTAIGPLAFQDAFLPYEDLAVIRTGQHQMGEMARLAKGTTAAITWSLAEGLAVILDDQFAAAIHRAEKTEAIFAVDEPPARNQLRVIKVASTQFAEPGETVDFTIRFDNVGNQPIRRVTVVDNLAIRLEYVPDTAQASVPAQFATSQNEAGSLVLRWEMTEPLKPGEGGVARFTCRVR